MIRALLLGSTIAAWLGSDLAREALTEQGANIERSLCATCRDKDSISSEIRKPYGHRQASGEEGTPGKGKEGAHHKNGTLMSTLEETLSSTSLYENKRKMRLFRMILNAVLESKQKRMKMMQKFEREKAGRQLCSLSREISFDLGASAFSCSFSLKSGLKVRIREDNVSKNTWTTLSGEKIAPLSPYSFLSRLQRDVTAHPSHDNAPTPGARSPPSFWKEILDDIWGTTAVAPTVSPTPSPTAISAKSLQRHLKRTKIRMKMFRAAALTQVYQISGSLLYCSFWYQDYYTNSDESGRTHDLTRNRLIHDLQSSAGCEGDSNCGLSYYQKMTDDELNTACENARSTTQWCSECLVLKHFRSAASCAQMCWTAQKDTVIDELLRLDAPTQDERTSQGLSETALVSICQDVVPVNWCDAAFCNTPTYQVAVAAGCPADRSEHKEWYVQFISGETGESPQDLYRLTNKELQEACDGHLDLARHGHLATNGTSPQDDCYDCYAVTTTTATCTSLVPSWQFAAGGGDSSFGSPQVVEGVVYIGSRDKKVYALNETTGRKLWEFETGGAVTTKPTVFDGVVFFGSDDSKVYAVGASNGIEVWESPHGGYRSSPAVYNGVVYTGSWRYKAYALNVVDGSKRWEFTTRNIRERVSTSPAVVDGVVYIGSYDRRVYALSARDGHKIWEFATAERVESSPAVVDGVVYIGSFDHRVYALSADDGEKLWEYRTGGEIVSSPWVVGGVVYIGSRDGKVYALGAADGSKLWEFTTDGDVLSSPAVKDGVVYIGSWDRKVYALSAADGKKIADFETGGKVVSSPFVHDGTVFIGSNDGLVYALKMSHNSTCTVHLSHHNATVPATGGSSADSSQRSVCLDEQPEVDGAVFRDTGSSGLPLSATKLCVFLGLEKASDQVDTHPENSYLMDVSKTWSLPNDDGSCPTSSGGTQTLVTQNAVSLCKNEHPEVVESVWGTLKCYCPETPPPSPPGSTAAAPSPTPPPLFPPLAPLQNTDYTGLGLCYGTVNLPDSNRCCTSTGLCSAAVTGDVLNCPSTHYASCNFANHKWCYQCAETPITTVTPTSPIPLSGFSTTPPTTIYRYVQTVGYCSGGPAWEAPHASDEGDSLRDCSPTGSMAGPNDSGMSIAACQTACDDDPECGAFDIEEHALGGITRSECCLFRPGHTGDEASLRLCYVRQLNSTASVLSAEGAFGRDAVRQFNFTESASR